jgi:large subunit ribosomal protein L22
MGLRVSGHPDPVCMCRLNEKILCPFEDRFLFTSHETKSSTSVLIKLPHFRYSFERYDPLLHIRASGREVNVSAKAAREVCVAVKGRLVKDAKEYLERVQAKELSVPFRRYKRGGAHRSETPGFHAGAYPVKAAKEVLNVLNNLEANAEFKGLDLDRLKIIHASAQRGRLTKGYTPRAQGRSSPAFNTLVHIEMVGTEA